MAKTGGSGIRLALATVAIWSVGCAGDEIAGVQSAVRSTNALTANALTANALTANALTANALTANALTANALTANALTANGLRDPLSRELLEYVVSCALDDDQSLSVVVDGQTYVFAGSLGLAPEWGERDGLCSVSCQRWVSACVLARVDAKGVTRPISIRGANEALDVSPREVRDFHVREAAYFGNLFAPGQPRFLCLAPGQRSDTRVCGASLDDCPMTVVGSCAEACAHAEAHGAFVDCSSGGRARHPEVFHESITAFLPK